VRRGEIIEKSKKYTIDAEIGRLGVHIFEIKDGLLKVFSTEKDVFPETGSREHDKTVCFREVVVFFPCDDPFRRSAEKINRLCPRDAQRDRSKQAQRKRHLSLKINR
jgi:hypothetical protein